MRRGPPLQATLQRVCRTARARRPRSPTARIRRRRPPSAGQRAPPSLRPTARRANRAAPRACGLPQARSAWRMRARPRSGIRSWLRRATRSRRQRPGRPCAVASPNAAWPAPRRTRCRGAFQTRRWRATGPACGSLPPTQILSPAVYRRERRRAAALPDRLVSGRAHPTTSPAIGRPRQAGRGAIPSPRTATVARSRRRLRAHTPARVRARSALSGRP